MAYLDPFLARGIDIPPEDQKILNRWHDTVPVSDGCTVPRLLSFEEAMEYENFLQDFLGGFPGGQSAALWATDDISALVGYYYSGPLKGTVYMLHGPSDVSPRFLSLSRFWDYYHRVLRDFSDDGDPNYEDKFWHDIDFNDNQPLTPEETERFHQAAQELMKAWKSADPKEDWYENLGFCTLAILPDCYAEELIPFISPDEDNYVLEKLCCKLAQANCTKAIPALDKLAEAEKNGLRIGGGWSDSIARRTHGYLLSLALEQP